MALQLKDLGKALVEAQYAVRGPIVARAQELEKQGREIVFCNIGNPQALKQKPLTYLRQVLALCEYPPLIDVGASLFPDDVRETARKLLAGSRHGMGAYSESKGIRVVRDAVVDFIRNRDGIDADPESIFLTDGASKGAQSALQILISGPEDGIMVPIPQYPLYSATITLLKGRRVSYYMDEDQDWRLSHRNLEEALKQARDEGTRVKGIVVINPGNPTGSVLDEQNVDMIIDFARENNLTILADEVYQENIYAEGARFVSFAGAMERKKERDVSLFSFHSCSKGYLGECGHRGGYFEIRNIPDEVAEQILKLQSISLCSNLAGQIATYCMVRPPQPGEESYDLFIKERDAILNALRERAAIIAEGLNGISGITSNTVAGAMYAFPRITLPEGKTDSEYCMALLEETGVCVVPGSGFGQMPGTAHFRTTLLPPTEKLREVVDKIAAFHKAYG